MNELMNEDPSGTIDGQLTSALPAPIHPPLPLRESIQAKSLDGASYRWQDIARCSQADARKLIPFEIARRFCVIPLSIVRTTAKANAVVVVFGGVEEPRRISDLRFIVDMDVIAEFAPRGVIEKACIAAYRGLKGDVVQENAQAAAMASPEKHSQISDNIFSEVRSKPIPQLVDSFLDVALSHGASDVHLETDGSRYRTRLRIDGVLRTLPELEIPADIAGAVIRRMKVLSQIETSTPFKPQEGGFRYDNGGWNIAVRLSTFPTPSGEKVVLRLLSNTLLDELCGADGTREDALLRLGLDAQQSRILTASIGGDGGAIVLSGPTGSGKSTLLYTLVGLLNVQEKNVVTIEDPVERRMQGVTQLEVNREVGLDYPELLPPLLRQDPDVILLGEIRDSKAASTALSAAITGHLMLTTVHAGSPFEVLIRLQELGVNRELMALALRLVVSQRLIPQNCENCRVAAVAPEELRNFLELADNQLLYSAVGCASCAGSGIRGRRGVYELLPIGRTLREELLKDASIGGGKNGQLSRNARIQRAAFKCGYRPLAYAVRQLLIAGAIAPRSALQALGVAPEIFSLGPSPSEKNKGASG